MYIEAAETAITTNRIAPLKRNRRSKARARGLWKGQKRSGTSDTAFCIHLCCITIAATTIATSQFVSWIHSWVTGE